MVGRVYEAAIRGNVSSLNKLLEEDANILDKVLADDAHKETPLHIAARFGHVNFVEAIISRKSEFTSKLNSQEQIPLHLASAEGHKEVAEALLEKDAHACFIPDREGRTPLHIAAIKGHVPVLRALVNAKKLATLIKTHRGEPLLHLCLNHDQFEAAEMLINMSIGEKESVNKKGDKEKTVDPDDKVFICEKDDEENTILHLLAAKRQYKIIKLLFPGGKNIFELDVNAINTNGFTALDLLREAPRGCDRLKITMILRGVKAKRARELPKTTRNRLRKSSSKPSIERSREWTNKTRDALMVVAILIATITYQAALNPPGGVLSEDKNITITILSRNITYKQGQSIMSKNFPTRYTIFMISNTIGFVHSILLILLLLSEFCFKRRLLMRTMIAFTWICAISMLVSYGCSFFALATENTRSKVFLAGVVILGVGWMATITLLFTAVLFRVVKKLLYKIHFIYYFSSAIFKIKDGFNWILNFLSSKCSSKGKNKNDSACCKIRFESSVP